MSYCPDVVPNILALLGGLGVWEYPLWGIWYGLCLNLGGAIYGAKIATAVKQSKSEKPMIADGFLKIRRSVNLSSRIRGWGWVMVRCWCN